jgi:protein-S-isoprenylcysteine O-methyltransferase Ste14
MSQTAGMTKSYSDIAARVRVPLGSALGVLFIIFAKPSLAAVIAGSAIAMSGLALRAAGAGCIAKNQRLAANGPYAYTRHPLYLGSALAGIGYCIAGGRWWFFLLFIFFFGAVYWPVIQREENNLRKLFPEYDEYARSVGVLPFRKSTFQTTGENDSHFSWKQYIKNREYEAFIAFLGIMCVLVLRMTLWTS